MIILGIDPGTTRMGYGVIESGSKPRLVTCGVIGNTNKLPGDRLVLIGVELEKIIKTYNPDLVGIEKVFFSKNKKTAISVSEARGVALFVTGVAGIPFLEFAPSEIKSVVAGDGGCDKQVLSKVVCMTLGVDSIPGPDDVSDALAIAIRASFEI